MVDNDTAKLLRLLPTNTLLLAERQGQELQSLREKAQRLEADKVLLVQDIDRLEVALQDTRAQRATLIRQINEQAIKAQDCRITVNRLTLQFEKLLAVNLSWFIGAGIVAGAAVGWLL